MAVYREVKVGVCPELADAQSKYARKLCGSQVGIVIVCTFVVCTVVMYQLSIVSFKTFPFIFVAIEKSFIGKLRVMDVDQISPFIY